MSTLKGRLLIASPQLVDPNFARTVTLLVRHDESSAFGLVLNRPTQTPLAEVWKQMGDDKPCNLEAMLHHGGPCQGPLMLLHTVESAGDLDVLPGLYYTVEKNKVEWLVEHGGDRVRCFAGYAGWSAGQLEQELKTGSWLTAPADADQVLGADHETWKQLIRTVVARAICPDLDPRIIPRDPSVN